MLARNKCYAATKIGEQRTCSDCISTDECTVKICKKKKKDFITLHYGYFMAILCNLIYIVVLECFIEIYKIQ